MDLNLAAVIKSNVVTLMTFVMCQHLMEHNTKIKSFKDYFEKEEVHVPLSTFLLDQINTQQIDRLFKKKTDLYCIHLHCGIVEPGQWLPH